MDGGVASRTETIRLGTGVTVLDTQDPVRVLNEFATMAQVVCHHAPRSS
ncbi:LLM class flavin-dependent oxidoreductase [Agromyces ramosus]|nr:LLM class flavin-dependent oxidoreductase [Agromyces ramosus]